MSAGTSPLAACVLAAGKGTRMASSRPKVLHLLAGEPLLAHVLRTAALAGVASPVVVIGHGADAVRAAFPNDICRWVEQKEQLGTGHAVLQALPLIPADGLVLILYGDVPLLGSATVLRLRAAASASGFALLTVALEDPSGYGRVLRGPTGAIERIVEEKDATPDERKVSEVNTGIMVVAGALLHRWLPTLGNANAQGEYYLTDLVARATGEGIVVAGVTAESPEEVAGVNDRQQLAVLERVHQRRQAETLMAAGVSLADPARFDVRGELTSGRDTFIDVNCVFEGRVALGERVRIGPNCVVRDCVLGDGVEVFANCVLEGAVIGRDARIGPFARLRPETRLAEQVHIGNFVEVKKSSFGPRSKANHLAYLGDSELGSDVNVGAGTITCNYDGAAKHRTVVGDDVFIGSDTQLVAPVTIGDGVTIGAGTTVTEDVPPGRLVISRVRQKTVSGWQRPRKPEKS